MRDREIQLNLARRKAADAEAAGRKDEAKLWYRKRKELNGEAIAYAKERGIHDVPTFSVKEVLAGKDTGQPDIDRLTHLRGTDGVTISQTQVTAIHEATAAAKRDLLAVLQDYPEVDPVSREEWRRLLIENGAPASAFGGELTRLSPATVQAALGSTDAASENEKSAADPSTSVAKAVEPTPKN
jgi:hypothetical protein